MANHPDTPTKRDHKEDDSDEPIDVDWGDRAHAELDSRAFRFGRSCSAKEGTEMLSQLVKFQVRILALRNDRGATAVEYGLMVALIAVVVIVAVTFLGRQVSGIFQDTGTVV